MKRNHDIKDDCYEMSPEEIEKLVKEAKEMINKNPQHIESIISLVEFSLDNDDFDAALELLDKGLKQNPNNYILLFKKAMIFLDDLQEVTLALSILESLINEFIHLSSEEILQKFDEEIVLDTLLMSIDCYRLNNQFSMAFEIALKIKEIFPDEEVSILALAGAHFELGEYKKALFLLEPNLQESKNADFLWLKGQIYCAQGEFAKADNYFKKAYELDEQSYYLPRRFSESEFFSFFEEALDEMPNDIQLVLKDYNVHIKSIVPQEWITQNLGKLSPITMVTTLGHQNGKHITIFQKNIENSSALIDDIKNNITATLIYELENIAD